MHDNEHYAAHITAEEKLQRRNCNQCSSVKLW